MTIELRTPRLRLRPVEVGDLDVLLSIRNAPEVVATTNTGDVLPRERMAGQLERRCVSWREHGLGSWLVLLGDEPVAFVEVAPIGEGSGVDPNAIEIGVVVHPDHWGEGLAVEAGLVTARDLFDRVGLTQVYAGVDPGNDKSLRALAKAPGVRRVDDELYELSAEAIGLTAPFPIRDPRLHGWHNVKDPRHSAGNRRVAARECSERLRRCPSWCSVSLPRPLRVSGPVLRQCRSLWTPSPRA